MVQEELKDIYEDSVIYVRYPGVPWDTLGNPYVSCICIFEKSSIVHEPKL